jgi:O-antigen ligase
MNMNIDELKSEWQSLNTISKKTDDTTISDIVDGKITSARDHLMKQYKTMFSIVAPIGCAAQFAIFYLLPLYVVICTTIYFVIAGIMDYYLYRGIKGLDLYTEGVTRIATKAKFYRRRHRQFQLILLPMAVILIILYFSCATEWQKMGFIVGIIIGLAVGLPTYFKIMRNYKQLSN